VSSIIYNKNALPPNLFESAEPLFGEPLFKSTSK
jgi:hypothetical protein